MSTTQPPTDFAVEANAIDAALAIRLAELRAQADNGHITRREYAELRVLAYERHLNDIEELRDRCFPDDSACREHLIEDCDVCGSES